MMKLKGDIKNLRTYYYFKKKKNIKKKNLNIQIY